MTLALFGGIMLFLGVIVSIIDIHERKNERWSVLTILVISVILLMVFAYSYGQWMARGTPGEMRRLTVGKEYRILHIVYSPEPEKLYVVLQDIEYKMPPEPPEMVLVLRSKIKGYSSKRWIEAGDTVIVTNKGELRLIKDYSHERG